MHEKALGFKVAIISPGRRPLGPLPASGQSDQSGQPGPLWPTVLLSSSLQYLSDISLWHAFTCRAGPPCRRWAYPPRRLFLSCHLQQLSLPALPPAHTATQTPTTTHRDHISQHHQPETFTVHEHHKGLVFHTERSKCSWEQHTIFLLPPPSSSLRYTLAIMRVIGESICGPMVCCGGTRDAPDVTQGSSSTQLHHPTPHTSHLALYLNVF